MALQGAIALLGVPLVLVAAGERRRRRVPGAAVAGAARGARAPVARRPLRAVTLITALGEVGWGMVSVIAPVLAVALGAERGAAGLILAAVAVGALGRRGAAPAAAGRAAGADRRGDAGAGRRPRPAGARAGPRARAGGGGRGRRGERADRGDDVHRALALVAAAPARAGLHERRGPADGLYALGAALAGPAISIGAAAPRAGDEPCSPPAALALALSGEPARDLYDLLVGRPVDPVDQRVAHRRRGPGPSGRPSMTRAAPCGRGWASRSRPLDRVAQRPAQVLAHVAVARKPCGQSVTMLTNFPTRTSSVRAGRPGRQAPTWCSPAP